MCFIGGKYSQEWQMNGEGGETEHKAPMPKGKTVVGLRIYLCNMWPIKQNTAHQSFAVVHLCNSEATKARFIKSWGTWLLSCLDSHVWWVESLESQATYSGRPLMSLDQQVLEVVCILWDFWEFGALGAIAERVIECMKTGLMPIRSLVHLHRQSVLSIWPAVTLQVLRWGSFPNLPGDARD